MNLSVLKRSRKPPKAGDYFIYKLSCFPDRYYWGRVIRTDASIAGFKDVILLYLYNVTSTEKAYIPELSRSELLVPPVGTNARPWTMGYFETVSHADLRNQDILEQHCFKDTIRKKFFDADGNILPKAVEPVSISGLHSFRTIDDSISRVLGIPLSSS